MHIKNLFRVAALIVALPVVTACTIGDVTKDNADSGTATPTEAAAATSSAVTTSRAATTSRAVSSTSVAADTSATSADSDYLYPLEKSDEYITDEEGWAALGLALTKVKAYRMGDFESVCLATAQPYQGSYRVIRGGEALKECISDTKAEFEGNNEQYLSREEADKFVWDVRVDVADNDGGRVKVSIEDEHRFDMFKLTDGEFYLSTTDLY